MHSARRLPELAEAARHFVEAGPPLVLSEASPLRSACSSRTASASGSLQPPRMTCTASGGTLLSWRQADTLQLQQRCLAVRNHGVARRSSSLTCCISKGTVAAHARAYELWPRAVSRQPTSSIRSLSMVFRRHSVLLAAARVAAGAHWPSTRARPPPAPSGQEHWAAEGHTRRGGRKCRHIVEVLQTAHAP